MAKVFQQISTHIPLNLNMNEFFFSFLIFLACAYSFYNKKIELKAIFKTVEKQHISIQAFQILAFI